MSYRSTSHHARSGVTLPRSVSACVNGFASRCEKQFSVDKKKTSGIQMIALFMVGTVAVLVGIIGDEDKISCHTFWLKYTNGWIATEMGRQHFSRFLVFLW